MEKKKMKVNPKKHEMKANLAKGAKTIVGIAATVIPLALAINKKDIKKN